MDRRTDKSQVPNLAEPRPLRQEEHDLISSILSRTRVGQLPTARFDAPVKDMEDGGMGGIRFVRPDRRRFGTELVRVEYQDSDGVLVSITLNTDDYGDLLELDFWKVDFSPLKRYPRPEEITLGGGLSHPF